MLPSSEETIDVENVRKFAEHFVQDVIDEAIKQSSKTTWLIHCSENCHRLNPIHLRKLNTYICWTPEMIPTDSSVDTKSPEDEHPDRVFSCNSIEIKRRMSAINEDVYTLPVDTVSNCEGSSHAFKSMTSHDKCLKPKAIHALSMLRSSHQKTFSDFKLFLMNLYSSDTSPQKLGSEHSAFKKYHGAESVVPSDSKQDRKKRKKKDDNLSIMHIKTETDLKMARKCNRIKRCNFFNIKHSFCNVFKSQKSKDKNGGGDASLVPFKDRSLPPLPLELEMCMCAFRTYGTIPSPETPPPVPDEIDFCSKPVSDMSLRFSDVYDNCPVHVNKAYDFASNIEKVKDYGWYWGPMSSNAAEKLLQNERDGSFIVRDSSDDRYIFSLTFKLNACIRHVRIEHGQGNFSFGTHTNFRSHTIVDFIENAVQHSRSGRYLFFLHRRPILGPMRVQLLYPVSRFKHVQSLQHMCRFVILKAVRRDLITSLPLPKPLIEYLSSKDYYIEQNF